MLFTTVGAAVACTIAAIAAFNAEMLMLAVGCEAKSQQDGAVLSDRPQRLALPVTDRGHKRFEPGKSRSGANPGPKHSRRCTSIVALRTSALPPISSK